MIIQNAKILYGEDFELIEGAIKIKNGKINKIKDGISSKKKIIHCASPIVDALPINIY
ncbi:MAG: hypothetical protein AB1485_02200 [Candidatus Thermoplasmatota archaeon]